MTPPYAISLFPLLLACCAAAALAATPPSVDRERLREALISGADRSEAYRAEAVGRPMHALLDELISRELAADTPRTSLSGQDLRALEQRLGTALPAELATLLKTPGGWQAMDWTDPGMIVRAEALGHVFITEIEANGPGDWRQQSIELVDDDSNFVHVPAGDLAHYLVLSRDPRLGNLVLMDPDPQPRHPCCVVIETTMFGDHVHSSSASLYNWIADEWSMSKAMP